MNNKTIIICGFPGIGKTEAANCIKNVIDLESSKYSKFPEFPKNYIRKAKELMELGEYCYILLSCHKEVRDELIEQNISFLIVAPHINLRDEYIRRYLQRGRQY